MKYLHQQEHDLEVALDRAERQLSRSQSMAGIEGLAQTVENAVSRAGQLLSQHWLIDKAWQILSDVYDRTRRDHEAEALVRKRLQFQKAVYPGLSAARAWTLEHYADMLLRHAAATVDPRVTLPDAGGAARVKVLVPYVYAESLQILALMFGEAHEHYTSVSRKASELAAELHRLRCV